MKKIRKVMYIILYAFGAVSTLVILLFLLMHIFTFLIIEDLVK